VIKSGENEEAAEQERTAALDGMLSDAEEANTANH
jgi:hypothetical protein